MAEVGGADPRSLCGDHVPAQRSEGRRGAIDRLLFDPQMAPFTLTARDETTGGRTVATLGG